MKNKTHERIFSPPSMTRPKCFVPPFGTRPKIFGLLRDAFKNFRPLTKKTCLKSLIFRHIPIDRIDMDSPLKSIWLASKF